MLKLKRGTKIAHVEASSVVTPMVSHGMSKNVLKKEAGITPKSTLLGNVPKTKEGRIEKILESLNLQSIESWNEQQQQSAKVKVLIK